ncbi:MAG TPA: hypothetical protein VFJ78_06060 [Gaiellaceae bacterium]|nr:hypothetical protein [Gaiellaceae bacterium]
MASAPPDRRSKLRRALGIVLIVLGALWSLLWAALWYAIWELTGAGGVLLLAFDWRFFGPTAVGLGVMAVGIWLQSGAYPSRGGSKLSIVVGSIVLGLMAVFALEWRLSIQDEGPYPFAGVPKGGLIAYGGPEGVRLVRSEGGRSWLVSGAGGMSGPVWAPRGDRLAATRSHSGSNTYAFAADGSARERLPFAVDTTPVWSPDGSRVLVVSEESVRIQIVRLVDGVVEAVLPIEGNEPVWSPDGTLIALQSNQSDDVLQIYLVRPNGTDVRRLTSDRNNSDGNLTGAYSAAWSPDGRRLAFASDRDGDAEIYIVRVDGTGLRKVTRNLVEDANPSWSPDGRRIVFDRTDYERNRTAIVVVDLTSGAETELVHAHDDFVSEPAWQPSGIE